MLLFQKDFSPDLRIIELFAYRPWNTPCVVGARPAGGGLNGGLGLARGGAGLDGGMGC